MPSQFLEKTRQNTKSRLIKIINGRIVRDHKIINDDVLYIYEGKIIDPQEHFFTYGDSPDIVINAKGLLIAPGYIDVQINGAFGIDFSTWKGDEQMKKGISAGTYKSPHLKLLNLSPETKTAFETSGFDMYIDTFTDRNAALASF